MGTFKGLYVLAFIVGLAIDVVGFFFGHYPTMVVGTILAIPVALILFLIAELLGAHDKPNGTNEYSANKIRIHKQNRMLAILTIFSTIAGVAGGIWATALFLLLTLVVAIIAYNLDTRASIPA